VLFVEYVPVYDNAPVFFYLQPVGKYEGKRH
jgi:hypothetical protein